MKAHRTDRVSLVFALIFLAVAAWWLFAQLTHVTLPAIGWLLAAALIVIGLLGLVGALRANRSGRPPVADTAGTSDTAAGAPRDEPFDTGSAVPPDGEPSDLTDILRFDRPGTGSDRPTTEFDRPTVELFDRPGTDRPAPDGPGDPAGPDDAGGRRP